MTITDARSNLAEVVDHVRVSGEPVYLTRRNKPVAVLVDVDTFNLSALNRSEAASDNDADVRERRLLAMETSAAEFASWVKSGTRHPSSASDLYASRAQA